FLAEQFAAPLATQPGGPNPTRDGPPAAGEHPPRKSRTRRAADRQSRADARRENHWHGAGVGWENGVAEAGRGRGVGGQPPIVPAGPAVVYSALVPTDLSSHEEAPDHHSHGPEPDLGGCP